MFAGRARGSALQQERAFERSQATTNEQMIPAGAVLVEQQDGLPRGATRACRREAWISISATRPFTPDSSGINPAMMRPRRKAS